MTSSEIYLLIASLFAGVGLGVFFFGALWLTVSALPRVKHPIALAGLSFMARLAVVAVGMYLISSGGQWMRLLAALVGFVVARSVMVAVVRRRWIRPAGEQTREG